MQRKPNTHIALQPSFTSASPNGLVLPLLELLPLLPLGLHHRILPPESSKPSAPNALLLDDEPAAAASFAALAFLFSRLVLTANRKTQKPAVGSVPSVEGSQHGTPRTFPSHSSVTETSQSNPLTSTPIPPSSQQASKKGKKAEKAPLSHDSQLQEKLRRFEKDLVEEWNSAENIYEAEEAIDNTVDVYQESISHEGYADENLYFSPDSATIAWNMELMNTAERIKKLGLAVSGMTKAKKRGGKSAGPPAPSTSGNEVSPLAREGTEKGLQPKPCAHQEEWEVRYAGGGRGKKGWAHYEGDNPCFHADTYAFLLVRMSCFSTVYVLGYPFCRELYWYASDGADSVPVE
ncbi:hypothetical protein NMY22_g12325 [Coprinellus aureogranulatus]|nr:hypothetical protein NMY22_g12325 [Coprinellus aureogranulatus]